MKKILSFVLTLSMCLMLVCAAGQEVRAEDDENCVDGSYLTDDESSEVTAGSKTRGVYLKSGYASIVNKGTGLIGAGGSTTGQTTVSKISVTVQVERLVNGKWQTYGSSWTATNYNSAYVSTSKLISVPTGYYYRVACTHTAVSDVSGTSTNGIYI